MPRDLLEEFTLGGAVPVEDWYIDEAIFEERPVAFPIWNRGLIETMLDQARGGRLDSGYGGPEVTQRLGRLIARHADRIRGEACVVLGSHTPWLEALLLLNGAAHVTTMDYAQIISTDPRVSVLSPDRWEELPTAGCIATFSSVEHSGLGRYGDLLNPWADIQTVQRLLCRSRPNAIVFVGVPVGASDALVWNANRIYGPVRLPLLLANLRVRAAARMFDPYNHTIFVADRDPDA